MDAIVPLEERKGRFNNTDGKRRTREEVAAESEPLLRTGSCELNRPDIAEMVQNSIRYFDKDRYLLHAWCLMGNHVHVVYTARGESTPKVIHHSWKSFTAHKANQILGTTGEFWEAESFDHLVRSVEDLEWYMEYTELNPVTAGFCKRREEWKWSSAYRCDVVSPA